MNSFGFLLVVIGAAFISLFAVESKRQMNTGWSSSPALFTALTSAIAAGLLVLIALATGGPETRDGWLTPVLLTGVLNIGIQFANAQAKALEDVSLVTPISATTPAALIFASMVILGEYPSPVGWLGIWLLVVGTYVLNIEGYLAKKREAGESGFALWFAPFLLLTKSRGVRFAFLSAFLATVSLNFDALAARSANIGFAFAVVLAIVAAATLALSKRLKEPLPAVGSLLRTTLLAGVLFALAVYWSNYAFRYGITPYVGTLKRLQIPLTIILAYILVGERLRFRERLLGGSVMAIGAVLIGLS